MRRRSLIQSQIIDAWYECIAEDYRSQRINSERSLQAAFWGRLNARLSKNRRVFIEPRMRLRGRASTKILMPDLVVCNTRYVIAVIELKYTPKVGPRYRKDINSLACIARDRHIISIANARFRGSVRDSRQYTPGRHVLFVWAGVHRPDRSDDGPYAATHRALNGCFLELHAETDAEGDPRVFRRPL